MHVAVPLGRGWVCTTAHFGRIRRSPPLQINNLRKKDLWARYRIREVGLEPWPKSRSQTSQEVTLSTFVSVSNASPQSPYRAHALQLADWARRFSRPGRLLMAEGSDMKSAPAPFGAGPPLQPRSGC